jgi:hypothetical protein
VHPRKGAPLVAAGSFQNANGTATADGIAYFDGAQWRPVGSDGAGNGPFGSAHPTAVGISQGKVYVGGNMTSAGGDTLAKFLAAYALRQPDVGISPTSNAGPVEGYTTGPFRGSNVYSATGSGETRVVRVDRGHTIRCYIRRHRRCARRDLRNADHRSAGLRTPQTRGEGREFERKQGGDPDEGTLPDGNAA